MDFYLFLFIFLKLQVDAPRDPELREACIGGRYNCPNIYIDTKENTLGDADCRGRAYPKYQKDPL